MDDEKRLRRLETAMHQIGDFLRHGSAMKHHGMHHFALSGDYAPTLPRYDYNDDERNEPMSKLPEITANTADELNAKTAAVKAEQERQAAIKRLARVALAADKARADARQALRQAKLARKALKKVRNNPDATVEEIDAAIEIAELN